MSRERAAPWSRTIIAVAALAIAGTLAGAFRTPAVGQEGWRAAVLEEPDGTAVAVSVLLNAGGVWEPEALTGVSYVAARATLEEIAPQFSALAVDAAVTCSPGALRFTMLAPRATWRVATDILLDALFSHDVGEFAVADAKAAVLRNLERERGNPEYEIRTAVRQGLYGADDRWARPACGETDAVATLTPDDVRAVMRARFLPSRAAVAVAGPVDSERAGTLLADALGDTSLPVILAGPSRGPDGGTDEFVIERNTVSSWTAIAYAVPEEAEPEALRLLGRAIEREFSPGASHPDIHGIRTAIERHGSEAVFVVYLVSTAESADARAAQVRERIDELGDTPLGSQTFELLLRDQLGARLRALAAPEARARDAVRQVFYGRRYTSPRMRIAAMTAERLRRATASLGAPTTAVLGPR